MRVLHFIDSLAPGGAETSLAALAPHIVEAGIRLDVASFSSRSGVQDALLAAGAEVLTIQGATRMSRARKALALIRSRQPDLVHTMLFEADLAGRIAATVARVPVVSTIASVAYGPEHRGSPGLHPWRVVGAHLADAATARRVCRFHAVSDYVASVMGRRLVVPASKIDVVRRGRDPVVLGRRTPERRDVARSRLGVLHATTVVLAVARHEHQKGLDVLVEAGPEIRRCLGDVRLVIAGREGSQTPLLRARAENLALARHLVLLGPRNDVADLLCAADVFVLPSRWEGLPGALLEAMALEVPLVASNIPPVREVVTQEHSSLVPPGQPAALARAVVTAVIDAEAAKARATRARERFESAFTIDVAGRGMVAFYERALGS